MRKLMEEYRHEIILITIMVIMILISMGTRVLINTGKIGVDPEGFKEINIHTIISEEMKIQDGQVVEVVEKPYTTLRALSYLGIKYMLRVLHGSIVIILISLVWFALAQLKIQRSIMRG